MCLCVYGCVFPVLCMCVCVCVCVMCTYVFVFLLGDSLPPSMVCIFYTITVPLSPSLLHDTWLPHIPCEEEEKGVSLCVTATISNSNSE